MVTDEDSAGRCTPLEKASHTNQSRQRGQFGGRYVLGAFIAVVLSDPLATAAIDVQSQLSTAGFSWLSATLLSGLIVAVMAAAALGEA